MSIRILLAILAASLSINALQWTRVAKVQAMLQQARAMEPLRPGTVLHASKGIDANGETAWILPERPSRPIVLYWLSPSCVWCAKNEDSIALLAKALEDRFDVVAVSSTDEGLAEYRERTPRPFQLLSALNPELAASYALSGTPTTVVIHEDKSVAQVWQGAYIGHVKDEVEAYFGVRLPTIGK